MLTAVALKLVQEARAGVLVLYSVYMVGLLAYVLCCGTVESCTLSFNRCQEQCESTCDTAHEQISHTPHPLRV